MIKLSFLNLARRKSRTILSMFGVIIGVAAIIVLVSLVDGMFADVQGAIGQLQGVMVTEEGSTMGPLSSRMDESFESKLESIAGVKVAVPMIIALAQSVENKSVGFSFPPIRLFGIDYSKQQKASASPINAEIIKGRDLRPNDAKAVVVGEDFLDTYNKFLGNKIKINGEKFTIIGVYKTGSKVLNSSVIFTFSDLKDLTNFPEGKVGQYYLELVNPAEDAKLVKIINFKYGEELQATTASDYSQQFGDILESLRLLVIAIAGISAVVAGIGIINTMLMSVVERFKEIGALKAVGWTNSNVMRMILYESIFIGIFGGIIGIILGIAGAAALENAIGMSALVSIELVAGTFLFAVFIGLFAGLYPAYLASKMNPLDALRTE